MNNKSKILRFGTLLILMTSLSSLSLHAGGTQEITITKIDLVDQARQFISPGLEGASKKTLSLPFSKITIPGTERVIKSWTFKVYNSSGALVYTDSRAETRDRGFFGELFNVGEKPEVEIPSDLSWDGTYKILDGPQNNQLVPDGDYTYQLLIEDDKGGQAQTPPFNVTIKNTPISIDYVRIPVTSFSPIGKRTTVQIEQSGSREYFWNGLIKNSEGIIVRSYKWENTTERQIQDIKPANFSWDGKDDQGALLPEGYYTYSLIGKNRAGDNKELTFSIPIFLSLKSGIVRTVTDLEIFSPNGDGQFDSINISNEISDSTGLEEWSLSVLDQNGKITRWSQKGKAALPSTVIFDGYDSAGKLLADGKYQIVLSVIYDNGNIVNSTPTIFEIDTTPPKVKIATDVAIFGGESKPSAKIEINGSTDGVWQLEVTDSFNKLVFAQQVPAGLNYQFNFEGKSKNNTVLLDDVYTIKVIGHDSVGNANSAFVRVHKDTRDVSSSIELSQPILVPGQANQGSIRITPILTVLDNIESMVISINDLNGKALVSRSAKSAIPFWDWNGKSDQGVVFADGTYYIYGTILYSNGSISKSQASLILDSKVPEIKLGLKSNVEVFSPIKSTMEYELSASPNTDVRSWRLSIIHAKQGEVQVFSGAGSVPPSIVWDGRTSKRIVLEGTYNAKLIVNYDNGLKGEIETKTPLTVNSSGPKITMSLSTKVFVPGNIDGPESLTISIKKAEDSVAVSNWSVNVTDERGKLFRTWSGKGNPPSNLVWDGKSETGEVASSGDDYKIDFVAQDATKLETRLSDKVTIDIQVIKISATLYKIVISSIQFAGNSSDIFKLSPKLLEKNLFVLQRLAVILNKFPDYKIRLEGYAVSEFWQNPKQAEWEQTNQLLPLSTDRANEVLAALTLLKVDGERFSSQGFGGLNPIVPHGDLDNRWKNRRVEFYLEKK